MKNLIILLACLTIPLQSFSFPVDYFQRTLHQKIVQKGKKPVLVLDLDESTVHSAKRKTMSYIEQNRSALSTLWPHETEIAFRTFTYSGEKTIRGLSNQYDSLELFAKMGVHNQDFIKKLDSLMISIYLSSDFIYLDSPYRGILELLNQVSLLKGKVYFVSSRFEASQMSATAENLKAKHLTSAFTHSYLVMRKTDETSISFKTRAFRDIRLQLSDTDTVLMVVENEPENLNAMIDNFPDAIPVFVQGAVLNTTVNINPSASVIYTRDFARE